MALASQEVRKKGVETLREDISGQGGTPVAVNEFRFTPDEVILDPNSPLAVQIPEGSDADRSRLTHPYADALEGAEFNVETPETHNQSELQRTASPSKDYEAESPASSKSSDESAAE